MPYSPFFQDVYDAAFSGALAGMAVANRYAVAPTPVLMGDELIDEVNTAGAFAEAVDTLFFNVPLTGVNPNLIQSICEGLWSGRQPSKNFGQYDPLVYVSEANVVSKMVAQAINYYNSEGIVSGGSGGGGGSLPLYETVQLIKRKAGGQPSDSIVADGFQTEYQLAQDITIGLQGGEYLEIAGQHIFTFTSGNASVFKNVYVKYSLNANGFPDSSSGIQTPAHGNAIRNSGSIAINENFQAPDFGLYQLVSVWHLDGLTIAGTQVSHVYSDISVRVIRVNN